MAFSFGLKAPEVTLPQSVIIYLTKASNGNVNIQQKSGMVYDALGTSMKFRLWCCKCGAENILTQATVMNMTSLQEAMDWAHEHRHDENERRLPTSTEPVTIGGDRKIKKV